MKHLSLLLLILWCGWMAEAQHQVKLSSTSPDCKNDQSCNAPTGNNMPNCLCNLQVYRASCTSTGCSGTYTQLPASGVSSNVTANGTAWTYLDSDAALTDNSIWSYYETATWQNQTPPTASTKTAAISITIPAAAAAAHQATLNFTNPGCTTAQPCWFQLYRAICTSSISCPVYTPGSAAFTNLANAQFPVWQETATGTTWQIVDADPALADATTYTYVGTVCWQPACTSYSPPSVPWTGTTAAGTSTPLAPSAGTDGNTISKMR